MFSRRLAEKVHTYIHVSFSFCTCVSGHGVAISVRLASSPIDAVAGTQSPPPLR